MLPVTSPSGQPKAHSRKELLTSAVKVLVAVGVFLFITSAEPFGTSQKSAPHADQLQQQPDQQQQQPQQDDHGQHIPPPPPQVYQHQPTASEGGADPFEPLHKAEGRASLMFGLFAVYRVGVVLYQMIRGRRTKVQWPLVAIAAGALVAIWGNALNNTFLFLTGGYLILVGHCCHSIDGIAETHTETNAVDENPWWKRLGAWVRSWWRKPGD